MGPDDPHTLRGPHGEPQAYETVFWNGNTASGRKNADRAVIRVHGADVMTFALPADAFRLESMQRALQHVHARGKEAAKREIRLLLGLPE